MFWSVIAAALSFGMGLNAFYAAYTEVMTWGPWRKSVEAQLHQIQEQLKVDNHHKQVMQGKIDKLSTIHANEAK